MIKPFVAPEDAGYNLKKMPPVMSLTEQVALWVMKAYRQYAFIFFIKYIDTAESDMNSILFCSTILPPSPTLPTMPLTDFTGSNLTDDMQRLLKL